MTQNDHANHFVLGTAGHVDHGKSTLVRTLTGIDPDRLQEEKQRHMTIDLGFAWKTLADGRSISIVDVPGHERFIKNMLAGVGGIDAVLLVVAADEGPMPQTREHLSILDLLDVRTGVVALTKIDTVEPEWAELVRNDINQLLSGTSLEEAPIIAVSATTGLGMLDLEQAISSLFVDPGPTNAARAGRMPVDRVFTMPGFGTVVTGTLLDGPLAVGQEVRVMPRNASSRIRGLHSHDVAVESVNPGRRVAINLTQLAVTDVRRGDVVTLPGAIVPTRRIDAQLRLLSSSPVTLQQNAPVDFFTGAAEQRAWITLLDTEQLAPGERGWVQIRLENDVAVLRGDKFIIRRPSPSLTIGGGEIVDPVPSRHRRFRPDVLAALEIQQRGTPEEVVLHLLRIGPVEIARWQQHPPGGLDSAVVKETLDGLITRGDVIQLGRSGLVVAMSRWQETVRGVSAELQTYHDRYPGRSGKQKEELRRRSGLSASEFDAVVSQLAGDCVVVESGSYIRLKGFVAAIDPAIQAKVDAWLSDVSSSPFAPPSPSEAGIDASRLQLLLDSGQIVRVADGVYFSPDAFRIMQDGVIDILSRGGTLSLAQFRDSFQTSRKYAQAVLEYLDQIRITRRVGDNRVLTTSAKRSREDVS